MLFLLVLLYICAITSAESEFDVNKHVFYEMYNRFSNQSTTVNLQDIDLSVLNSDNLVYTNRTISGHQNCRWNWNPNKPTRIFIHGYFSTRDTFMDYARAYLERGDFNFIAINWLKGAITINYKRARNRVREIGEAIAKFVDYLVTIGLNMDDLILVGHSLGMFRIRKKESNVMKYYFDRQVHI